MPARKIRYLSQTRLSQATFEELKQLRISLRHRGMKATVAYENAGREMRIRFGRT